MEDWLGLETAVKKKRADGNDMPVDPVHHIPQDPQEEVIPAWTPDQDLKNLDAILAGLGISEETAIEATPSQQENSGQRGLRELPKTPAFDAYQKYINTPKNRPFFGAKRYDAIERERGENLRAAAELEGGRLRDENTFYRTDDISERDRRRQDATAEWRRITDENTDQAFGYRKSSGDRKFNADQAERERRAEFDTRKDARAQEMHRSKLKHLSAQLNRINRNMTKLPTDSKISASEIKKASDMALSALMNEHPELQQYGTNNFGTWSVTNTPEVGSEDWDEYRNMIDEVEATQNDLLGKRMSDFSQQKKIPSAAPKKRVISPNGVAFQR